MWAFAIKQKMKASILLFTVLGLVMLINMREQRTVKRINKAVTSIYEDRLVVAQYILRLSKKMEGIITALEKKDSRVTALVNTHLTEVTALNALYEETTLTEKEKTNFETFKRLCHTIAANNESGNHAAALSAAQHAGETLQDLSLIQVEEGKKQLDEVLNMTSFSNILSYLELAVLIVIAVIIQILVFASKTTIGIKKPGNERLN
ncbi:chemoreceptor-like protein with four helix bundle sensory module [Sphingobacterium allocomposti]|uniref:Chemoreceptor-like protein with four helix bundle sensory module n=1 Tax=Sphingobacterium allocomposti TaxID=415956 RepID=A0A5S5DMC4_9SPHI|nr:MCP four helix bundle domain-containing protein [Sphingobacterium composti Yoo et al. 2007 non Ten et al. 2007]TYP97083.1 chemoreceptor-like protein with four helix bundle sensory module [Sphingobacterium composti Yoo et al. 2007 non Ten et al. 2007]